VIADDEFIVPWKRPPGIAPDPLNVPLAPFEVLVTLAFALSLPLEASALGHRVGAPAEPLGLGRVHGATAREPAEEADLAHAIRTTGCSSTDLAEMPS